MNLTDWIAFKNLLAAITVEKDALHIYASLLIQLAAAFLLRKPLSSLLPWIAVLVAALLNEAGDLILDETEKQIQQWQISGALHDLANTMVLPTILLLLVRYAPNLFRGSD